MSIPTALEDHHKQLIQYFLHDGAYNEHELIDLLTSLRDRYDLKMKVKDEIRVFKEGYLPLMNKHLNQYGIDIKQVTSEEHENDVYFVCVQNFKAQFVKLDTSYTEKEAAVFEKLLQLIITSDDKCITPREIHESILANDLKMTQKEFAETMTRFQHDKWIESGPNNTVILHPRAILEMRSFITDIYQDDVATCQNCRLLLIRGLVCSNSSCDAHLHRSCAARYFQQISNARNGKTTYPCPSCKKEWKRDEVNSLLSSNNVNDENGDHQTTTTTTTTVHKRQRTSRASNQNQRPSNRRTTNQNDDDDDDD